MIFARPPASRPRPRAIAHWLLAVAFLVFLIVVIGGITRLTESGLSITEWAPVTGAIPPLNEADWLAEFAAYQQTTQFRTVNSGMDLAAFKQIYFWEYLHRLMGRIIGLAFLLPLLWFAWKRAIPQGYGGRLVALFVLGGLQGVIGWWMVVSGLAGRVEVSHIRLAVHLLLAFVILAALIWAALDLRALAKRGRSKPARLTGLSAVALLILFVQLLLGAFTAGLDAGHAFSSWPKMGDEWFPSATPMLEPAWRNLVDNPIVVQFAHRWWAFVAVVVLILLARAAKRAGDRRASIAIHSAFGIQILLGIATLHSGVDIVVATLHQAFGALVLASATWGAHVVGRRARDSRP